MEIKAVEVSGRVPVMVLSILGDIDVNTSDQLLDAARAASASGSRHMVLDLSQVNYVSSAGIRALTMIFHMLRADNSPTAQAALLEGVRAGTFKSNTLKLVSPAPQVDHVLKTTGLDMYLEILPSVPDAVESF